MFIRRLPKFEYHAPTSLQEAIDDLARYGNSARVFAGGTDLFVSMKKREAAADHLINLKGVEGLRGIRYDAEEGLRIGALTTIGDIERSKVIGEHYPILWDAARVMAAPQVRNLGTVGGNLCSAVPSADTAPPLMALGASLVIEGAAGRRFLPVESFFKGPGRSALAPGEILAEVVIPPEGENRFGAYLKLMRRNAMDLALVGAAVALRLEADKKTCTEARIALGAVAPTPMRAPKAEDVLRGKEITEDVAREAGRVASQEARPISDIRATEDYRRSMVGVLTRRATLRAFSRINGSHGGALS